MKKFLSLLLAGIMIFSCLTVFASCASKPEMDLDDAEENLEDEDYYVSYDEDCDDPGYKERLSAYKNGDSLTIIVFSDSKLAEITYKYLKNSLANFKKDLEREIKTMEHILKKYDDDMSSSEIDDMKDKIKDYKKELEEYDELVIGKSGKTVWYGTKDAIKDSKV